MRKKKLVWNTITALILQAVTLICGFVLPRLILRCYGSEINGLVNSIAQFLQVISLMEFGIGTVMQSSLYKPLAEQDANMVSCVVKSGTLFFRRVGLVLCTYVIILIVIYPQVMHQQFSYWYTASLILTMSISLFAQYYFGITNQILLSADQKGYVQNCVQMVSILLNTIACTILMIKGCSIHAVKLVTSLTFLIRPLVLSIYVNKNYKIDRKITYIEEPIKQKWNGVSQHIAAFILDGTDNIVLTIFSSLTNVSIYSVYNMVILGIKNVFMSLMGGIQSILGDMFAKREMEQLVTFFGQMEWIIHTGVTMVFGCTAVLIVPFIKVYTNGINDAIYEVPAFAVLLTLGNAIHCFRLPYNMLIKAGGHYKQTQGNYIIAALMNIVISIVLVRKFGLVGVALGTLSAMLYQTVWMAHYVSKNLIKYPFKNFLKQICVDLLVFLLSFGITKLFNIWADTYMAWIVLAVKVSIVWLIMIMFINIVFYHDNVKKLIVKVIHRYF